MNTEKLCRFEERIGYVFKDKLLLRNALTHSSYINSATIKDGFCDNERLEFLGDAVLGLCVGEQIFRTFPGVSEGVMSRTRANAVCENALYEAALKLNLPDALYLGYGETMSGGKNKPSILSDALEAVIGAIYLDGGLEKARSFILSFTDVNMYFKASRKKDEKTRLQEFVQEHHMGTISYVVINTEGPDHKRIFTIEVRINDKVSGTGKGQSKHEAGMYAAREALAHFEHNNKE